MNNETTLDHRFSSYPDFKIAPGQTIVNFELRAVMILRDTPFVSETGTKPEYKIYTKSDFTTYFPGSIPDMWTIYARIGTLDKSQLVPVANLNTELAAQSLLSIITTILSANNLSIPITI